MRLRRRVTIALLGAGCSWLAVALIAQGQQTFKTRLSALPADAKTRPDLAGTGSVTAMLSGSKLTVNGTFEGLRTPATSAKLHAAVAAGVRGPAFADLTVSKATSGTISGSADLTAAQLQNLNKGGIYVQIYSEKPVDGTLWGWLLK